MNAHTHTFSLRVTFHMFSRAFSTRAWEPKNACMKKEVLIGTLEVTNSIQYVMLFNILNGEADTLYFPIEMLAIWKIVCVCVLD